MLNAGRTEPVLFNSNYLSVLGIRDILVRIRMRILGSVLMANRSGCGSGRTKNIRMDLELWYIYIIFQR
jgi:hypothetical protein